MSSNGFPYVGLMVHGTNGWQCVDAYYNASRKLGVVAEVPDADVPKIQALIGASETVRQ